MISFFKLFNVVVGNFRNQNTPRSANAYYHIIFFVIVEGLLRLCALGRVKLHVLKYVREPSCVNQLLSVIDSCEKQG